MYARDHPPPHFHALDGEHEANVSIETGEVIEGALPRVAVRLVRDWAVAHREQLRDKLAPRSGRRATRADCRARC